MSWARLEAIRALRERPVYRATAGALATGVASQLVLVASGVLVARLLGPTDRGYLALIVLVPVILVKLGTLGLPTAVTYELAREVMHPRTVLRSLRRAGALQGTVLVALHAAALVLLLHDESPAVQAGGAISLLLVPAHLAQDYGCSILQGLSRFKPFNVLRMMPATVYSAGVVSLTVAGVSDLVTVAVVWTVANIVIGATTLCVSFRAIRPGGAGPDRGLERRMVRFGAKALFGAASPLETFRLDQAVVGLFLAPVALGFYVTALAFTNLPRFLAQSLGMVLYPYTARQADTAHARRAVWRFFALAALVCGVVVVGLELTIGFLLPFLFGDEFAPAVSLSRLLILAAMLIGLRRVLSDGARGVGQPGLGSVAELASWAVLVPAVAIGASRSGVDGVAVAVLVSAAASFAVMVIGMLRAGQRSRAVAVPLSSAPGPA